MLRHATIEDFDFIFNLTMHDAEHGHYDSRIYNLPAARNGFRLELLSILEKGRRVDGLMAQPLIQQRARAPIGFLILSAGPENSGNEIWMASISPKFRRRGFGKAMIEELVGQFKGKNFLLLARCAPVSETMFNLLRNFGFRHTDTGPLGTRFLIFER